MERIALMSLSTRPKLRLLTLCALYVAQGIPYGFITITLAAFMADQGLGTEDVGNIIFYSTLPWAFKWVWGPFIDMFGIQSMGRRRPWIILAQLMMAATMLLMVFVSDLTTSIVALSWMTAIHNTFGSLQDVAVDALAVDLLEEDERGQANGLMWGSKYFGVAIGGAGLGTVASYFGLRTAIMVQVLILLGIMLLPLLHTERVGERVFPWSAGERQLREGDAVAENLRDGFSSLLRAFSLRSTLLGVLLAVLVNIGSGVIAAFIPVFFMTEAVGWTKEMYTQVQGGPAVLCGVAGAATGGFLVDRFGDKTMIAIGSIGFGVCWMAFYFLTSWWESTGFIVVLLCASTFLNSVMSVGLFALFMGISWSKIGGTQFTAYMAMLNLSTSIGTKIAGPLENALGSEKLFLVVSLISVAAALPLLVIDRTETRRVLGASEKTTDSDVAPTHL
jgi:MFS transporter, PAT family, beta-lactamase induction signal transducer AmpG